MDSERTKGQGTQYTVYEESWKEVKTQQTQPYWEKAFDKVTREGLESSLKRTDILRQMVNAILSLYSKPRFKVEIDGRSSDWYLQETGIRQGCPLSPYLF